MHGQLPLARFVRLLEGMPAQHDGEAGQVQWAAHGSASSDGRLYLELQVKAQLVLVCQRCMGLFTYPVDSDVTFELVHDPVSQDVVDEGEDLLEGNDEIDGDRVDLMMQIEDELILSVPYVPKHEQCPGDVSTASDSEEAEIVSERVSPFAVLSALKQRS